MKAQSTVAKGERIRSTWPAAAGGALVILVLASGLGLGLGAVVNRLTMPDQAAGALSGGGARRHGLLVLDRLSRRIRASVEEMTLRHASPAAPKF